MTRERDPSTDDARPPCGREGCDAAASFWLYRPEGDRWWPICERHLLTRHPSIEVDAWLESGYARPIELGEPRCPPAVPSGGRGAAFRELVADAMGWEG
jgi:hypothetical protein